MQPVSANFGFLKRQGEALYTLAALAEHYFGTDPNTCLCKLRRFGEPMARDIAARAGLLNEGEQTQAALIGAIGRRSQPLRKTGRTCSPRPGGSGQARRPPRPLRSPWPKLILNEQQVQDIFHSDRSSKNGAASGNMASA